MTTPSASQKHESSEKAKTNARNDLESRLKAVGPAFHGKIGVIFTFFGGSVTSYENIFSETNKTG